MATAIEEKKELIVLPELSIQIIGEVKGSNLVEYKKSALDFIESISTDLKTDEDFTSAATTIKFCDSAEKELQKVKTKALSETADIEELFRTVDELTLSLRTKRLALNKLSTERKTEVRTEIVDDATKRLDEYLKPIYEDIKPITLPNLGVDFNGAIKGKKTVKSLKDAVNAVLESAKVKTEEYQERIKGNLNKYNELASEHKFLFNDLQQMIFREFDYFELLVTTRITEYKADEQKKIDDKAEKDRLAAVALKEKEDAKALQAEPETVQEVEVVKTAGIPMSELIAPAREAKTNFSQGHGCGSPSVDTSTPAQEGAENKKAVNNAAMADFIKLGLSPSAAKCAVKGIAMNLIRKVAITY